MADRSVGAGHCLSAGAGGDHLLHGGPGVVDYPISGGPPSSHLLRHHYSDVDMYAGGVYPSYINSSYCLLYTSPSPRDRQKSRMPSSA